MERQKLQKAISKRSIQKSQSLAIQSDPDLALELPVQTFEGKCTTPPVLNAIQGGDNLQDQIVLQLANELEEDKKDDNGEKDKDEIGDEEDEDEDVDVDDDDEQEDLDDQDGVVQTDGIILLSNQELSPQSPMISDLVD